MGMSGLEMGLADQGLAGTRCPDREDRGVEDKGESGTLWRASGSYIILSLAAYSELAWVRGGRGSKHVGDSCRL